VRDRRTVRLVHRINFKVEDVYSFHPGRYIGFPGAGPSRFGPVHRQKSVGCLFVLGSGVGPFWAPHRCRPVTGT